ncbi:MAG TPA: ABC transporter ATP-binding protein [Myxococcales bacterium]|nr:ABC transporter ATP-binding protein [Myxococcales bacterium]
MLAVETSGLSKTYRRLLARSGQRALVEVNLAVARGDAFGLIGPNGAGKTTFIKLLLGIAHPSAGSARLFGASPRDPAARARVGYLPERLDLPAAWTPLAFLRSVGRLKAVASPEAEARHQLERVGMAQDAARKMGAFSKGMRQRVGLASALMGAPELLVLDEPTDGLDPLGRVAVREILAAELARGATLFLNSHLLAETERICRRVGILSAGRLVREGPLDALCAASDRWRVRFGAGADAGALAAAGFRPDGEPGVFHWDGADVAALNQALDRARQGGALLAELGHAHRSLEDVLAEAVTQGRTDPAPQASPLAGERGRANPFLESGSGPGEGAP